MYVITAQRFGVRELQLVNCSPSLPRARVIQRGTRQLLTDLFTDRESGELTELWDVAIYQLSRMEDVHEAPVS